MPEGQRDDCINPESGNNGQMQEIHRHKAHRTLCHK